MADSTTPTSADVIEGMREALRQIDDIANGRDSLDAYPRSAGERLRRLTEIAEITAVALALPDSKPDNQGGS